MCHLKTYSSVFDLLRSYPLVNRAYFYTRNYSVFCLLQNCSLMIGAYTYYHLKMNITSGSKSISTHDFQPNGEWDVFHTTATWNLAVLDCCPGIGYAHVVFTLHMKVSHTQTSTDDDDVMYE